MKLYRAALAAPLTLTFLSLGVLLPGAGGLSNLRPLLGREYVRPMLQEADLQHDLTFRGDILGDAVIIAAKAVDRQRANDLKGSAHNESEDTAYPSRLHAKHRRPLPEVKNDSYFALTAIRATKLLKERLALSGDEVAFRLPLYDLASTRLGNVCPPHHGARYPTCDPAAVYRTADGTCNNAKFSWWGSARSAFVRLLPPDYGDKVDSPRLAVGGSALPSSRRVSATTLSQRLVASDLSDRISLMVMQWGQFLDHDLSHTPMNTATLYGRPISCCDLPFQQQHPDCYPIPIPKRDSLYRQYGQTCMEFVRSVPAVHNGCGLGPREQVNQVTSYIDGSMVYGSSVKEMNQLRQLEGGQLKMANNRLPTTDDDSGCIRQRRDVKCFQSGDIRVNEQPDLTTLHTLWLREHNRVAGRLQRYCAGWSDEKLFQESRRLVSAMLQHITYREWLPLVIGADLMNRHDLTPLQTGLYHGYSPNVDATIANVFATGAMRFGHTLVPDHLMLFSPWHTKLAGVSLHKSFFRPHSLYHPGRIDEYMAGLTNANSSEADNYLVDTIRNKLFARLGGGFGLDLGALNIQRGRDHGLPGYVHWRRACGLTPVTSFAQLKTFMNPLAVAKLITTYKDVADVDLYVGGLLETPLEGALVGPTLACLVAHQFQTLKRGDRFWYENGDERHSFTPGQLAELRKVTLAKVICDNSALATAQPSIMFKPDDTNNRRVKCRHLAGVDLRAWAGQLGCAVPTRPPSRPGGWRPGSVRPPPFWPGGRPGGVPTPFPVTPAGGAGWPSGYPGQASGQQPIYWPGRPRPGEPRPGPAPTLGQLTQPGQTPASAGTDGRPGGPGVDPSFGQTPSGLSSTLTPAATGDWMSSRPPGASSTGGRPAGGVTSAAAATSPAQSTDDSVERPVYPGSEPTEPVRPSGDSGSINGGPPSWQPEQQSGPPPGQMVPVDPPVQPPSQPTPGPAVIPVDPPILPPSQPTPGPEEPVDPPVVPLPIPTPGPVVIPVDPPVLPPSKPTPGPLFPVPVDPPILPPGEPLQPEPPVDPPMKPSPLPTPGPDQPIHPPVLAPAPAPVPAPGPGAGIRPPPLPTPGPDQPIHPPVFAPAPAPVPTPGPDVEVFPPVRPPPLPLPSGPAPPPQPTQTIPIISPAMVMSAMRLTIPATMWPSTPGKQLVIVAGRKPVVTIIPVPRPAIGPVSATVPLPPIIIFPTKHDGGAGMIGSDSTKPTTPPVTMTPGATLITSTTKTSSAATISVTSVTSTMTATSVTTMSPVKPLFPPGFDPDYPVIPPGEMIEIEPTDTGPSGGETTVTVPSPGTPDYPDYPDYGRPVIDPDYPDYGKPVIDPVYPDPTEPVDPEYPDYGQPGAEVENPDDLEEPVVDPGNPQPIIDPVYPDYEFGDGEEVSIPTSPADKESGHLAPPTKPVDSTQDFDYPTIPEGETIAIEPTDTDYDDGPPTVVSVPDSVLPGADGDMRPTPPAQLESSMQQLGTSTAGWTSTTSTPTANPAVSQPEVTPFLTGATLRPSVSSFLTGATLHPSVSSFLTGATLSPSISSFLTGATLHPSISSFLTGATLSTSVSSFLTGATLNPSISSFLTGATLRPSASSFLTGATLKPSVSSFLTGATLKPSISSILTGATLKPSISSFLTGATLKPSVSSFLTGATLKPSLTSLFTSVTRTKFPYPPFTFTPYPLPSASRPSRPQPTTSWLTFETTVSTASAGHLITTIRPGLTAVTVRPTATLAPVVVTSIVWPRPGPAMWPPRPRPGPPVISIIAGPTPTMSGVHRPGATLTIESASMGAAMPPPIDTLPRPTATLTVTVTAQVPGRPQFGGRPQGGYPSPAGTGGGYPQSLPGGYPRPGGVGGHPRPGGVGGYPRPGGIIGGYPRPGGVGGYPRPGGFGGYPRPGGLGGYPRPGGTVGGYPRPGGVVGGYPRPGGVIGGYPIPSGSATGYPRPGTTGGGYPKPPPGGLGSGGGTGPEPSTDHPGPGEPEVMPEEHSDTLRPQMKPTGDVNPIHSISQNTDHPVLTKPIGVVKPIPVLPAETEHPVQTKPIGDVEPVPVLPSESDTPVLTKPTGDVAPIAVLPPDPDYPVQTKPIGDVKPIPVLPAESEHPVQTKPIGAVKPIPVLPAEPDNPVLTKPIGDADPIPVLPSEESATKPAGDPHTISGQQSHLLQTKPNGQAQPMPVHLPDPDHHAFTRPIGAVQPIPVLPPDPQPSTETPTTSSTSMSYPWTQRPTDVTTEKPPSTTSSRPSVAPSSTTTEPWTPRPSTVRPRPSPAAPAPARPGPVVTKCRSTGAWHWIPGMSDWCTSNCLMKNPPFCPPTHCRCW